MIGTLNLRFDILQRVNVFRWEVKETGRLYSCQFSTLYC